MARRARTRRMAGGRRKRLRASRKSRKRSKSRRRSRRRRGGNMVMKAAVPFTLAYLNSTYGKRQSRKYRR